MWQFDRDNLRETRISSDMLRVMARPRPGTPWRSAADITYKGDKIVATVRPCKHEVILAQDIDDREADQLIDRLIDEYLIQRTPLRCERCSKAR
jgi:hypothetical protein